jgi:hypothetical protein
VKYRFFLFRSNKFKFPKISQNVQQKPKSSMTPSKKISQRTIPCDDALLIGANKRFVLLYNMNIANMLYIFDMQKDETKEFQWDEGILVRKRHLSTGTG